MKDKTTARHVLEMFDSELIGNKAFLEKLLSSDGYQQSISPRVQFSDLNERSKQDISNLLGAIALWVIQLLLPQQSNEGYGEIMKAVTKSKAFRRHVMPDVGAGSEGYDLWVSSHFVKAIMSSFDKLGKSDKENASNCFRCLQISILMHG